MSGLRDGGGGRWGQEKELRKYGFYLMFYQGNSRDLSLERLGKG